MKIKQSKGSFTLPGESGYERLTLELAEKWGADMLRDSDGTALSPELLDAGFGVYSTICIIRDHNEWAKQNRDKLQQTFLMTQPRIAEGKTVHIALMQDFFAEQFSVNESPESLRYWQVYDRTAGTELPRDSWSYENGVVTLTKATPWHRYTVGFLAYRVWEEISMYNHTTNNWDKEHLMQLDPIHPETQAYMLAWLEEWCKAHPDTSVVRFTSLFYNFVWIWGSNPANRHLYSDWASYDFAVSPKALELFEKEYGYALTSEDFLNGGKLHVTHMPPVKTQRDWMDFVNAFVTGFGKELVDVVHRYGKKAYVFYDDSWIGLEPYSERFPDFEFDGLIKCVFSGFEARLCAGASGVQTKELRLHPYLFPVGLGGAPTFMPGGDPARDALGYWVSVRRALLRAPVDRIGLGGYLHLTEGFPEFVDCIAGIADEFRQLKALHGQGAPECLTPRIAVLTAWGKLRSWTCSGHLHENPENDLIHVIESLSGLPFEVEFIDFEDVRKGVLERFGVVINAGFAGSAWSGGGFWHDDTVVTELTRWTHGGGVFIGVNAPSALEGRDTFLRMAHVLGVDIDTGARVNHGKWPVIATGCDFAPSGALVAPRSGVYLSGPETETLLAEEKLPCVTTHAFGAGMGVYLSSFRHNTANAVLLRELILRATKTERPFWLGPEGVDCAYFPESGVLALANVCGEAREVQIGQKLLQIAPHGLLIHSV